MPEQINGHPPPGAFEQSPRESKRELSPEEMRAKTKEMRIANRYRRNLLESQVLMEAFHSFGWDGFGGTDTTEFFLRARSQAGGLAVPPATPNDRRGGAKWPLWRTDAERHRTIQASRLLAGTNDFAKAMLRNSVNHVIGKGFSYRAQAKENKPFIEDPNDPAANEAAKKQHDAKKKLVEKVVGGVQAWIDEFCERNNWNTAASNSDVAEDGSVNAASSTREREAHWRTKRDGEAIIRLFRRKSGRVDVRFVGPEVIYGAPAAHSENDGWSAGVQHFVSWEEDEEGQPVRVEDLERIVAYYIRPHSMTDAPRGKDGDGVGEVVSAADIVHVKDPWEDAEVKRGTPVFAYDTFDAILRATNLQRNISITSAVQAATAEVWKHTIGDKAAIQRLAEGHPFAKSVSDGLGAQFTEQRVRAGQIRRVPAGQEPVPDPATTQVPNYMQAAQGDLRQAGASGSMPEYMISGDASNANYASTQEAGTPYVRSAEAEQEHFKMTFLRLMWRVVRWAVKCGMLPQEALTLVKITVEGMEVHKNNEGELSQARSANLQAKVTSPQIEIGKLGNDVAQVMADWKEWDKAMGQDQGGAPPGMPGAPQPPPGQEGGGEEAVSDADDPFAGVPEEDLSGEAVSDAGPPPDPKRSMAAKQGWANRGHISESAEPAWIRVPADILEAIGAPQQKVSAADRYNRFRAKLEEIIGGTTST